MEGVEVLVIDLFIALVEVDHPVSSLPGHFSASLSVRTSELSAQLVTLAPGVCAERFRVGMSSGRPPQEVLRTRVLAMVKANGARASSVAGGQEQPERSAGV